MCAIASNIQIEDRIIYNDRYERVYRNPISKGAFGSVFLVKNITNGEKYVFRNFLIYSLFFLNYRIVIFIIDMPKNGQIKLFEA